MFNQPKKVRVRAIGAGFLFEGTWYPADKVLLVPEEFAAHLFAAKVAVHDNPLIPTPTPEEVDRSKMAAFLAGASRGPSPRRES